MFGNVQILIYVDNSLNNVLNAKVIYVTAPCLRYYVRKGFTNLNVFAKFENLFAFYTEC